jgi:hypothetical protein
MTITANTNKEIWAQVWDNYYRAREEQQWQDDALLLATIRAVKRIRQTQQEEKERWQSSYQQQNQNQNCTPGPLVPPQEAQKPPEAPRKPDNLPDIPEVTQEPERPKRPYIDPFFRGKPKVSDDEQKRISSILADW